MSAILEGKPDKNLILVTGRTHPKLAAEVAEQLGIDVLETTAYDFANGEMYVRYTESVRGADVFVLQSHCNPINQSIMEQLIMIDALKRASARSITAVCPLLGYSRQDKKHRGREPISCRLVFDLLKTAGADRIMSVDLHAAQSQGFFDGPVDHLIAMPVLVDYIRDRFANQLDKDCVLVDDLIDTAGTIAGACSVLKDAGAKSVTVVATHGVLSGPAIERLKGSGAREVVLTDTVPIPEEKRWDGLTVLSIAPLLASAIRAVFEDGSVAELFDTYPEHHGQGFLFA